MMLVENLSQWVTEKNETPEKVFADWTVRVGESSSILIFRDNGEVVDLSDPDSKYYGHQIRYTPRHSGGGTLRWEHRWVNLGATAMVVGHRYAYPQNNVSNRLPAYCDLGFSADRRIDLRWGTLRVQMQVLNLLDAQYEVVQFYPMMGRNYRLSLMYEF